MHERREKEREGKFNMYCLEGHPLALALAAVYAWKNEVANYNLQPTYISPTYFLPSRLFIVWRCLVVMNGFESVLPWTKNFLSLAVHSGCPCPSKTMLLPPSHACTVWRGFLKYGFGACNHSFTWSKFLQASHLVYNLGVVFVCKLQVSHIFEILPDTTEGAIYLYFCCCLIFTYSEIYELWVHS